MDADENTITLHFTPDSMKKLRVMAKKYNTTISNLIAKSLALLQTAQDKTIILRTEVSEEVVQISGYEKK